MILKFISIWRGQITADNRDSIELSSAKAMAMGKDGLELERAN